MSDMTLEKLDELMRTEEPSLAFHQIEASPVEFIRLLAKQSIEPQVFFCQVLT